MAGDEDLDYRFSLANERTFLAWTRTSLALVAGGVAAAKALDWQHDIWRWVVAAPPILGGAVLAFEAIHRWRVYERTMREGGRLPVGRGLQWVAIALGAYAVMALIVTAIDT